MFGANPIAPPETKKDGTKLRIVDGSPFVTVQGEGPYAGHAATFIRLHGCNLRCTFCDTQFSDPNDPIVPVTDLVAQCIINKHRLVVITGGEPMRQNIVPLCTTLTDGGFTVQVETAGLLWLEGIEKVAKLVVSPKTKNIHPKIREHAAAFKYIISQRNLHYGFLPNTSTQPNEAEIAPMAWPRPGAPVYLSPCDEYDEAQNKLNRKLVARMAIKHNVIAGLQLHKFFEVD